MDKIDIGDTIEWDFIGDEYKDYSKYYTENTFQATVGIITDNCYGVYAEYGMDYIPFESAKLVKKLIK
jgi:hypothetical protein